MLDEPATHWLSLLLGLFVGFVGLPACGYGSLNSWNGGTESGSSSTEASDKDFPELETSSETGVARACNGEGAPNAGDAPARLMTSYEYANTVRDLLGYRGSITDEFPAENEVGGFENNVTAHRATRLSVRKYQKAAEKIAADTVESRLDSLLPCDPKSVDETECGEQFVEGFLERAFRRPPTDDEVANFKSLFDEGRQNWNFEEGVELVVRAALQSPQFLYRLRFTDGAAPGESRPLDDYEIAERLAYFLWASTPDDRRLEAARTGELHTEEQIERHAREMLDDPRARSAVFQFHRQWLGLDKFDSMTKDGDRYPEFESAMTDDWRDSLRRFVNEVYFADELGTVADLLESTTVFLSDRLAQLYDKPAGEAAEGVEAYDFDAERRSGLLTQPGLMALLANANQRSPIRRGVWVREQLLCEELAPPPPDADTMPPDPDPDATTRERFRQHTENPKCASCHQKIDPVGFGFEHYDALGRRRDRENGKPIDASGEVVETSDDSVAGEFEGAIELADRLRDSRQVQHCLTEKWFTFALGRNASGREKCSLKRVQRAFVASGGDFEELLVELATSEAFRYRTLPSQGSEP